jgi:hypothetical protein
MPRARSSASFQKQKLSSGADAGVASLRAYRSIGKRYRQESPLGELGRVCELLGYFLNRNVYAARFALTIFIKSKMLATTARLPIVVLIMV